MQDHARPCATGFGAEGRQTLHLGADLAVLWHPWEEGSDFRSGGIWGNKEKIAPGA